MNPAKSATHLTCAALAVLLTGCGDDSPTEVELQKIEETVFAASLGINLDDFTILSTGVYVLEVVPGTGFVVEEFNVVELTTTGYLPDGTVFQAEVDLTRQVSVGGLIIGFEDGIIGKRAGGEYRLIIPPERAWGNQSVNDVDGNVLVPAGSVVIFDVRINAVQ